ncbi:switch-associated protein 70-like [Ciona intestinalis]
MERRVSRGKSLRRLSMRSRKKPLSLDMVALPQPNFEFEDVLVSQLHVADVVNNCVMPDSASLLNCSTSPQFYNGQVTHKCYSDTTLNPIWHAFSVLDLKATGKVLLGRLMNMTSSLTDLLGEEYHTDVVLQKQFLQYAQVPFFEYKKYVMETATQLTIDADKLCATCWSLCRHRYLNNPLVDNLDSVVPNELAEALYWLFCIFNKLSEPNTYPPSMDYEEAELLLRKLCASLGIQWQQNHDDSYHGDQYNDNSNDEYEPLPPLQVTFQQLLSVISDMIGPEVARSHAFYRSMQWLCLTEYSEIMKTGWLYSRRPGADSWKKRWAILRGTKLTLYVTVLGQYVKEQIYLTGNMHVESLPSINSHKQRFRIVEKEGDYNITSEYELATADGYGAHAWISLIDVAIKIFDTGMSPKTSEVCERRYERFQRRESAKEVWTKKRDVLETYSRLVEAKKARSHIEQGLGERAKQREAQMSMLIRMDRIYESLESIQLKRRHANRQARENKLMQLYLHYHNNMSEASDASSDVTTSSDQQFLEEERELEQRLQELKVSPDASFCSTKPQVTIQRPSTSEYSFDLFSSSETTSTASDMSLLMLPEATSLR